MCTMAKNVGGRRIGAIRGRTQFMLPNGHYAKRNRWTGEIMSVKADLKPYKNVIIERESAPVDTASPKTRKPMARIIQLPLDRAA